jgi:hypothetical protein
MPRLYFRSPTTGAMIPLTLGGSGGGNEVTISTVTPTDGSELWLDMTANRLMYRSPINGQYIPVPGTGGAATPDGYITAGSGLTGSGYQSSNPTLAVGAGSGITVDTDTVSVNKGTLDTWYDPISGQSAVTISDWNYAVNNNTAYMAADAANGPSPGWWFGTCLSYSASWKHQTLVPFANSNGSSNQYLEREMENGVWGDWNRVGTAMFGNGLADIGIAVHHNPSGANMGTRRTWMGLWKDKGVNGASNADEYRVQYYNTAGTYTGTAIKVPMGTGVVSHPAGHSRTMSALRTKSPISPDTAATVGVVLEIVAAALQQAGIDINPTQIATLMEDTES